MTFGDSIKTCLSKFVTWQGRASRSEYWYFILFALLCYIAAAVIDNVLGTTIKIPNPQTGLEQSLGYGYAYVLVRWDCCCPASLSWCAACTIPTVRAGGTGLR